MLNFMPSDDFFYFSPMYSDRLLTEFLPKVKNEAYQRFMEIQKNIYRSTELMGDISEFFESKELDRLFGCPSGSKYLSLENFAYPVSNQIKFVRKFGKYHSVFSLRDIWANYDIFDQTFRFTIGDYYFDSVYFGSDKFHHKYLIIKNQARDGITKDTFKKLKAIGGQWFLWRDKPAAVFQTTGVLVTFLRDSPIAGKARLEIPLNSAMTKLYSFNDLNAWDLAISADSFNIQNELCAVTQASMINQNADKLVVEVDGAFLEEIRRKNVTVKISLLHRPNRRYSYVYIPTSTESPILFLAENGNPIPATNIKIYSYDPLTKARKARISMVDNDVLETCKKETYLTADLSGIVLGQPLDSIQPTYFPAIYDFSKFAFKENLFIEIVDFPASTTNAVFSNHLSKLLELLGPDTFRDKMVTGEFPESIRSFSPINVKIDYDDFVTGPYKADYRRYLFSKLIELINSDPWIYMEYIKFINDINHPMYMEAGTPNHFKLNTGLEGELTGSNPIVTDNGFMAIEKHQKTVHFSEPCSYIKIHCAENPDAYARVFINGMLVTPMLIDNWLDDVYIFLPVKKVADLLRPYGTTPIENLRKAEVVIVELFPGVHRSLSWKDYTSMTFDSPNDFRKLYTETVDKDKKITVNDLVFYNPQTKEYIDRDNFTIRVSMSSAVYNLGNGPQRIDGEKSELEALLTSMNELYLTKDMNPIYVNTSKIEVTPDIDLANDPAIGGISTLSDIGFKQFALGDIEISLRNQSLFGTEIWVFLLGAAYDINAKMKDFTQPETSLDWVCPFTMDFGRLKHGTVEVYLNGTLAEQNVDYTIEGSDGMDTKYELHIKNPTWEKYVAALTNPEKEMEVQIRYLPMEYHRNIVTPRETTAEVYPYQAMIADRIDMPTIDGMTRIYPNSLRTTVNWSLGGEIIFKRSTEEKGKEYDYIEDYQTTESIFTDVFENRILVRYGKPVTQYTSEEDRTVMKNLKMGSSLDAVIPAWCVNELL